MINKGIIAIIIQIIPFFFFFLQFLNYAHEIIIKKNIEKIIFVGNSSEFLI